MRCARCQSQNREGATFCEDGGARLELACPNCGEVYDVGKRVVTVVAVLHKRDSAAFYREENA